MAEAALGCARNSDGSLRDASEVQWYNDAADEHPISGPSSSGASTSVAPLHPIFTKGVHSLDKVGGVRPGANSGKRKASPAARQPAKKAQVIQSESSGGESDAEFVGDGSEPAADAETDGENTESASAMEIDEYEKFKAMGDADGLRDFAAAETLPHAAAILAALSGNLICGTC
ncbi:hypothetical protein DFH09DRAFT_1097035 [Mycena vulgaris]|nr:hypothetical protein DFH09DRAFT_1097035 [Mycena vulgaris]